MEQRLSVITVAVSDLGRSRQFYEDGLGWSPVFVNDEIAFYQLNGVILGLFARGAFNEDVNLPRGDASIGGIALAHNVRTRDAVDDLLATARAAGARITQPARDLDWGGRSAYFMDPDGHLWEVAWNPAWPIDNDGNVTFPRR